MAPDAAPAFSVRLKMHGEIRLRGWYPFTAEQAICWDRGMVWQASIRVHGIPIRGSDSLLHDAGASRWKVFGIFPLSQAEGPDVTRSAAGRVNLEAIWLPAALASGKVLWTSSDATHAHAGFYAHGQAAEIDYTFDSAGAMTSVNMPRWGKPGSGGFRYVNCGGFTDEERTFQGYTIPTRIRVGWYFGTPRFEEDGEFFRAFIDDVVFK